jgi:hypothetical protein
MYVRYGVRPKYNIRMCLCLLLFGCCNGLLCVSSSFVRSIGSCQYSLKLGGSNCIFILIFVWDVFCSWWPHFYLNVLQYCMCCDVTCVIYTRKEVVAKEAIITVFICEKKAGLLTGNMVFVWIMLNSSKKFCVILRASFNVLWSGWELGVYFSKSCNSNYLCSVQHFCEPAWQYIQANNQFHGISPKQICSPLLHQPATWQRDVNTQWFYTSVFWLHVPFLLWWMAKSPMCLHQVLHKDRQKKTSMVWVREWTIPTERPPLVGEVIANFLRIEGATWSAWRISTAVFSVF